MNLFKYSGRRHFLCLIKKWRRLSLSFVLCLCLLLQSCSASDAPDWSASSESSESKAFSELTDAIFRESVSSDALSLNYTLSNPEKYGIEPIASGFEPISVEQEEGAIPETENLLHVLEEIDQQDLTLPQQILYDSLLYTLQKDMEGQPFLLFSRPISPVTGLQAQLPVLLAEYNFDLSLIHI